MVVCSLKYVFLFVVLWICGEASELTMQDFFLEADTNLTKITWAHAVNNRTFLNATLENGGINMIEADIVLGQVDGKGDIIPIMGHPPANKSDLSLQSFFEQIKAFNTKNMTNTTATKKGVKLDFKTIEVFEKSVTIVKTFDTGLYPIWINADILPGPINSTVTPVDANRFLNGTQSFPNSILSIGWTTLYGNNFTGSYNIDQINAMIQTITDNKVDQEIITFPVRAGLAAKSKDILVNLTDTFPKSTLTLWSSEGDNVDIDDLRKLIKAIGINRTYVDVPSDLLEKLHLDNLPNNSCASKVAFGVLVVSLIVSIGNVLQKLYL